MQMCWVVTAAFHPPTLGSIVQADIILAGNAIKILVLDVVICLKTASGVIIKTL